MRVINLLTALLLSVGPARSQNSPPSSAPSNNWWSTLTICHSGGHANITFDVDTSDPGNRNDCPFIVFHRNGKDYAFSSGEGNSVGSQIAIDNIAVMVHDLRGCDVAFCYYKNMYFGFKSDGQVVIANPLRESSGSGDHRCSVYLGNGVVNTQNCEGGGQRIQHCFDGTDWFEGEYGSSCDMKHHSQLVNLVGQGEQLTVLRPDFKDQ